MLEPQHDEGARLHFMAEAVLAELDESDDGRRTVLTPGADARLEAELAKFHGSDELLGAVEALIVMASHADKNLRAPDIAGRLYSVAVSATPALIERAGQRREQNLDRATERKAAFSRFTDRAPTPRRAPRIDAKAPDAAMPLVRLKVPSRFR